MTQSASNTLEGLQFFGRVSASVSHEIKNVFAVINEAAGLIEDFTLMAEKGMPLDPERLKKAANAIQGQVRRGDGIVKNMNAFSHSIDEPVRETDLVRTLDLTVALATRLADMRQVKLSIGDVEPASLVGNQFELMRLLHSSIVAAFDTLKPGDSLVVGVRPVSGGASFSLSSPGKDAPLKSDAAFSSLAQTLNVRVKVDETNGTSDLFIPAV